MHFIISTHLGFLIVELSLYYPWIINDEKKINIVIRQIIYIINLPSFLYVDWIKGIVKMRVRAQSLITNYKTKIGKKKKKEKYDEELFLLIYFLYTFYLVKHTLMFGSRKIIRKEKKYKGK